MTWVMMRNAFMFFSALCLWLRMAWKVFLFFFLGRKVRGNMFLQRFAKRAAAVVAVSMLGAGFLAPPPQY
ncbi:hypothetical protein ELY17_06565 [Corynebacterium sp. SY003]|uniref:hypothetical protein n=1 Tax=Corynebacterium sp. SY003 TaxID=2499164 RepID=UPI00130C9EC5|nr:hypothetical protein [Corynebacterium sp. SY003]TSD91148.1 hypothetical protein ELY17_06565 [Corynebacterium sp. SY003]